jgi:uncharacterized protein (DUF1778 family)
MKRSYIRVPKSHEESLAKLFSLPEDTLVALTRALDEAPPTLSIRELADHVASKTHLDADDSYDLLRILTMLYTVRAKQSVDAATFTENLCRAARETGREELQAPKAGWERFKKGLAELFGLDHSLGVTAKALDVLTEHDRVFCDARVLTDIRPVFAADVEKDPSTFIMIHNLRIAYHQDSELKTIYIALDSHNVRELIDVLNRAVNKEKSLKSLATQLGLSILPIQSRED